MDWHIACAHHTAADARWSGVHGLTHTCWQRGGAALLADLIEAIGQHLQQQRGLAYTVHQIAAPKQPVVPGDPRFHHTYSLWTAFPYSERASSSPSQVWRMAEWLGLERSKVDSTATDWMQIADDPLTADLVILDDADLGFRDQPAWWPRALQANPAPWVLLKMAQPVAQGPLWDHLHQHCADRLIVVTTIDALRHTEVQISRELSWERTAQDLAWELVYNPRINALAQAAHVIVTFGAAGAMLVSRPTPKQITTDVPTPEQVGSQSRLFFDPQVIEGMWEQLYPGGVTGYTSCLIAALAHQLMLAPANPNIEQAVQSGLAASRKLHQAGYGRPNGALSATDVVTFPIHLIVDELAKQPVPFAVTPVQDPGQRLAQPVEVWRRAAATGPWTILENRYVGGLEQVAQQIVLQGAETALQGVPLGQFGALLTVDRQEIESFRSLRALVSEYCRQASPKRPLSIAVFGTPGSGKSFGVTEVARTLLPGQIEKLEFNLSQFDSPRQLLDAFHRVRDLALSGRIPLVFWDEFDTALEQQALGWLRHFLAPMQDGVFQERQIIHPIGRAIFVFAGGTSETMADFDRGLGDAMFRAAKGPDFVSRLKGYVNIVGPNPRGGQPAADPYYLIRRAILLRLLLQRNAGQIFQRHANSETPQIDSGVLRAFLEIPAYKHGARSLEAIVTTSTLVGQRQFERSALPTEAQLNLHVDGRYFLSLVQRLALTGELLEKLAAAAHEIYRASVQTKDRTMSTPLGNYADLSAEQKEQNRQLVRDMPNKLAYAGYVMRPARSDEPPFTFPGTDREALAEIEHERWLKAMLATGWRYGPEIDQAQKIHPALLPWRAFSAEERARRYTATEAAAIGLVELPDREKAKDRDLIDGIPHILAHAGYTLIKVRDEDAND